MIAKDRAHPYVNWLLRHGALVWGVAFLVMVPAAWATTRLYINLNSDVEELLPRDAPSVRATDELRARLPGLSTLGVVVDAGGPAKIAAAERLLDDLAARVRGYPTTLVANVRTGGGDERRFFETYGPLYVTLPDLVTIRERIAARRSWETRNELGINFDEDEGPPPLDFSDIVSKYRGQLPEQGTRESRFTNAAAGISVLLIEGTGQTASATGARQLLNRVRADLHALGGPEPYAPGMRVGFAGNVAVSVEELSALSQDLGISSVLVVTAVLAVIWLYFGWWISLPVLLTPLAIGTVASFALASVLPVGIDRLNSS